MCTGPVIRLAGRRAAGRWRQGAPYDCRTPDRPPLAAFTTKCTPCHRLTQCLNSTGLIGPDSAGQLHKIRGQKVANLTTSLWIATAPSRGSEANLPSQPGLLRTAKAVPSASIRACDEFRTAADCQGTSCGSCSGTSISDFN